MVKLSAAFVATALQPSTSNVVVYTLIGVAICLKRYNALELLLISLLALNWQRVPLAYHIRLFSPIIKVIIKARLYRKGHLRTSRDPALGLEPSEHWQAIARSPWAVRACFSSRATWSALDNNIHMSNSVYATDSDHGRTKIYAEVLWPLVVTEGIYGSLAGTHSCFLREIPMGCAYEVETHSLTWDDKYTYLLHRWLIAPTGDDLNAVVSSATQRRLTVAAVSISKLCFFTNAPLPRNGIVSKTRARQPVHTGRFVTLCGSGEDSSAWQLAKRLRKARESRRWLVGQEVDSMRGEDDGMVTMSAGKTLPLSRIASAKVPQCRNVFTPDNEHCFVASFSSVLVYSLKAKRIVSELRTASTSSSTSSDVLSLLLNPHNPLQLLVGSKGSLDVWDYTAGEILKSIPLDGRIIDLTGSSELHGSIFALVQPAKDSEQSASVQRIDLIAGKATTHEAFPLTAPTCLAVDPRGEHVVVLDGRRMLVASASDGTMPARVYESRKRLTALAIHPTEPYVAVGDSEGQIRLWYCLSDASASTSASAVLHWHAHRVRSLAFTPNGAYLLSAGEEAVLVIWQLETHHKEYLPRLGSGIVSVAVSASGPGEMLFVTRHEDGSSMFISSQSLKLIGSLKSGSTTARADESGLVPIAYESVSNRIALPASHPSTLQLISLKTSDSVEIEIAPTNRIVGEEGRVEPPRISHVAFSTPQRGIPTFMATIDRWQSEGFAQETYLKIWQGTQDGSYALVTRIDRPHSDEVTSVCFSQTAPLLVCTTSKKGQIKLWQSRQDFKGRMTWSCRSVFDCRQQSAFAAAFSFDGSLLAIAHQTCVSLWNVRSLALLRSISSPNATLVSSIVFAGKHGQFLVYGGRNGISVCDVYTCDEIGAAAVSLQSLHSVRGSDKAIAVERSLGTDPTHDVRAFEISLGDTIEASLKIMPGPMRSLTLISDGKAPAFAFVDANGSISLAGTDVGLPQLPARLPDTVGPLSLLSDLLDDLTLPTPTGEARSNPQISNVSALLDAAPHTLPPLRTIWRELLRLPVMNRAVETEQPAASMPMDVDEATPVTSEIASIETPAELREAFERMFAA
ncbi:uncharacterized protein L969DRAFT_43650 [Mixia osmundae IAM 14324]|uniref:WD repeat-containing protein 75 second beta-propeller domain-containing protein n=1 Tax=Mixia osmundae (strain CBS 9802 / IAM 14324 / JCM 22182 / KY 12970) TaxID=764103 RepID=G7DZZ9_MIXOS|nr:uncharacterized protein L969DRAFT_43650 [Mixia osmundae IAM 14324]KEI42151.1 hypothetical protein L969DRAFT_43650 [Mixia osmundae IAM 14324]GAA96159.1 hypothetical protein E5Q_02820 [Mixia osmundae IAM 14324]